MSAGLRYLAHPWRGADEWVTVVGQGAPLLLIQPLLEEMNRCRAVLVATARALPGYAVHLPDLPGTGESARRLQDVTWEEWRAFLSDLALHLRPAALLSVRGGCLLEPDDVPRWRLSPVEGMRIARELVRARRAAGHADASDAAARERATEFAGYLLSPALYAGIADATVADAPARTLRLRGEAAPADTVIDAAPPWRTAEPRRNPAFATSLAEDVGGWLAAA